MKHYIIMSLYAYMLFIIYIPMARKADKKLIMKSKGYAT